MTIDDIVAMWQDDKDYDETIDLDEFQIKVCKYYCNQQPSGYIGIKHKAYRGEDVVALYINEDKQFNFSIVHDRWQDRDNRYSDASAMRIISSALLIASCIRSRL